MVSSRLSSTHQTGYRRRRGDIDDHGGLLQSSFATSTRLRRERLGRRPVRTLIPRTTTRGSLAVVIQQEAGRRRRLRAAPRHGASTSLPPGTTRKKKSRSCGFPGVPHAPKLQDISAFKRAHSTARPQGPGGDRNQRPGAQSDAALCFRTPPLPVCRHRNVFKQGDSDCAAICSTAQKTGATTGVRSRGARFIPWRHRSAVV